MRQGSDVRPLAEAELPPGPARFAGLYILCKKVWCRFDIMDPMSLLRSYWVVALPVSFFLTAGVLWLIFSPQQVPRFDKYSNGHIAVDMSVLDSYYQAHGGAALVAYAEEQAKQLTRTSLHATGHNVGEILYRHEGMGAVADCGDSFQWGCLHQVIGELFNAKGPSTIKDLTSFCATYPVGKERGNCEHGLGHGITYASGYDPSSLNKDLDRCDSITPARPIPWNDSCHAGVMMEYNMHFIAMDYDGQNGRPVESSRPLELCEHLGSKTHQAFCVWWAVPWLHGRVFKFEYSADAMASLGAICKEMNDPVLLRACYRSIGRSVGVDGDLPAAWAAQLCTSTTDIKKYQRLCIAQAASVYRVAENNSGAQAICDLVADDPKLSCVGALKGQSVDVES